MTPQCRTIRTKFRRQWARWVCARAHSEDTAQTGRLATWPPHICFRAPDARTSMPLHQPRSPADGDDTGGESEGENEGAARRACWKGLNVICACMRARTHSHTHAAYLCMHTQGHKRAGTQNRTYLSTSARAYNALTLACMPRLHFADTLETGGDDLANLERGSSHSWKTILCGTWHTAYGIGVWLTVCCMQRTASKTM